MGDIYAKYDRLERAFSKLESSTLSDANRKVLKEFGEYLMAENLSDHKIYRYLQTFRVLSHEIDFDLQEADRQDLIKLVGKINQNRVEGKDYKPESKAELKKALKKFYKWQRKTDNPEITSFISCHVKHSNQKSLDPDKLPSYDQVQDMIEAAKNPRDKALIYVLWESGARVGEFLTLTWNDISMGEQFHRIDLKGKTGKRTVPIRESRQALEDWQSYQYGHYKDLWTSLQTEDRLAYSSFHRRLKVCADRADVECKVNPHAFRKSRATYLAANGANVFQLMEFFGWRKAETAKTYVRLAQSDVDNLILDVAQE